MLAASMLRRALWAVSLLLASAGGHGQALIPPAVVRIVAPEARLPIELRRVEVQARIAGLAVATRVEFELRNPNRRELEGELQFPLLEGQEITGFALDIDGELRPAVPVEKAKGRQVFEDVTRARVDPALLEATQGNNYRLRVYPLPAGGTRRVVLEIGETLRASAAPLWRLPLQFGATVGQLALQVQVAGQPARALSARLGAVRLPLHEDGEGGTLLALARQGYQRSDELRIALPATPGALVTATETLRDRRYLYAEVGVPTLSAARARPARIALVWDASGSGAVRDHAREFALLDAYFAQLGQVEVLLQTLRDVAGPVERFAVNGGQWAALRRRLETLAYDGATQLGAVQPPAEAQLALLFSDGLGNYGAAALAPPAMPLYAFNAATSADPLALRRAAEASGGAYIDLLATPPAAALQSLTSQRSRLLGLRGVGAGELESLSVYPEGGRLVIAGVLSEPEAEITLELSTPDGVPQTRRLRIKAAPVGTPERVGIAARRWASLRMARLAAEGQRQQAAMRRLGLEFGMVGSETSLIVLDNVADYARYEIEPPPSLRPAWQQLMARKTEAGAKAQRDQIERVAAQFAEQVTWWETDFPKDDRPRESAPGSTRAMVASAAPAPVAMAPLPAPAPAGISAAMAAAAAQREAAASQRSVAGARPAAAAPAGTSIQLKKWEPDSAYARRLRAAKDEDLYAIYLDERPAYTASTAFFLDVADILAERGQPQLAARVLSNLAEMALENRHILRILAYRLLQLQQVQTALPLLDRVLALSPDEPQSLRDLALALAQAGRPQEAVDRLWELVARPWQGRFPGIELIALAELNAIVARQPGLDTARIDPRLLRNLPLALRAVLAWDADNTDIDLWVIDPNGERAYYAHRLSYQGGLVSRDFTGGYGPETFSLRRAKPGRYTIRAQFYGHRQQIVAPATTLMLKLSSDFGTPQQKDEDVVLRLSGAGQEVTVGSFEVAAPGLNLP